MVLSEDRPMVRLELGSSPETLTLVRAMLGGVAEEAQPLGEPVGVGVEGEAADQLIADGDDG